MLPFELSGAESWVVGEDGVSTTALPQSDIFIDPSGQSPATHNAATLLGRAQNWIIAALRRTAGRAGAPRARASLPSSPAGAARVLTGCRREPTLVR